MPKQIPLEKEEQAKRLWTLATPYEEIMERTGISRGKLASLVEEVKKGGIRGTSGQEVKRLRVLAEELRKGGLTTSDAIAGLHFFQLMKELGIEPTEVNVWADMCRGISLPDFPEEEFISAAHGILELKQKGIMDFGGIAESSDRIGELSAILEEVEGRVERGNEEIIQLEKGRDELQKIVSSLQVRKESLKEDISRMEKEIKSLKEVGFGEVDLTRIRKRIDEVAKDLKLHPKGIVDSLLANVSSFVGAEGERIKSFDEVEELKAEERKIREEVKDLTKEKEKIVSSIEAIKEAGVKRIEETSEKAIRALRELSSISEQALKVGREVGEMKEKVREGRWIEKLTKLVNSPQGTNFEDYKVLVLNLSLGIKAWVEMNQDKLSPSIFTIRSGLDSLMNQLGKI
jgi:hypothetical protein